MDQVLENYMRDPSYCPYCLVCETMERMRLVGPAHWRCKCGGTYMQKVVYGYVRVDGSVRSTPGTVFSSRNKAIKTMREAAESVGSALNLPVSEKGDYLVVVGETRFELTIHPLDEG